MWSEARGAYGFRIVLPEAQARIPDLGPVDPGSPSVAVEWHYASGLVERAELTADRVAAGDRAGPTLVVERDPASITLGLPEPTTPEALIHPLLTPPISILARWRGDLTLHAGSFFAAERAWAVLGTREAGKSTTLTMLAEQDIPVLADDLLVLDGDVVRAGPACVDLRPDVAKRVPAARSLGEVGGRERFRLQTPQAPARAPLAGFFLMDWSEDDETLEVERMATPKALEIVYGQEYMGLLGPADPRKILDLLGTPMWRVSRPRDWAMTDEVIDRILEVATANGG